MPVTVRNTDILFNDNSTQNTAAVPEFVSGTVLIFAQTAAPTGWTKNTTTGNQHALRVVTGTAGTGGTVDFTTAFASKAVTGTVSVSGSAGNTTLTTPQIPSHRHPVQTRVAGPNNSVPVTFTIVGATNNYFTPGVHPGPLFPGNAMNTTGGDGSHSHPLTISSSSFSGNAIDMAVRYIDVIRATKN
jgi:hypothetical protein